MSDPAPLRVCFVGDSLVLGVGDTDGLGWAGRLAARARREGHDLTAYNLGIRRETSLDVERRWRGEVEPRLPAAHRRAILFSFGTNDCLDEGGRRRVAPEASLAAAERILRAAAAFAPVLMIGPPPAASAEENRRIAALAEGLGGVAVGLGVPWFDLFARLRDEQSWHAELRAGDGYHPAARGYERIAAALDRWAPWRDLLDGREAPPAGCPAEPALSLGAAPR